MQQRNEARSRVGSAPSVQQQAAEAARRRREMGMSIQQAVRSVDADVKMNRSEQRALQQSEARSRVGADSTVQQQAAEAARRRLEMSMSTREAAASVDADVRKDESFRQQQLDALRSEARSRLNANSTAQQQMVEAARRRQELGMSTRDAVASVDADIRRYQESLSAQQAQQRQQEMRAEARSRLSADSTVQDQMVEAARRRLEMGMSTREATASVGADMESHQINRREQMAQEGYRIATETVIERKLRAVQAHTKKVPQVRKVTPAVNPRQSGESSGQR